MTLDHQQKLDMQSDLEFLRGRFEELNQDIKLPHSLNPDFLRQKLENLDLSTVEPKKPYYLWKAAAGLAACFVFVFGAVWSMQGKLNNAEMPASSAAAFSMQAAPQDAPEAADAAIDTDTTAAEADTAPQMAAGVPQMAALDENGSAVENLPENAPAAYSEEAIGETGGMTKSKMLAGMELTSLEQARAVDPWGTYLPVSYGDLTFQSGYAQDESLYVYLEAPEATEELRITIRNYSEEENQYVVDPEASKTYDLRLYQMPYVDSVPVELQKTLLNPIFKLKDITADVAQSRIIKSSEPGDEKYQGNLNVLMESEQILVEMNATGMEPDAVLEIVQQIKTE